MPIQQTKSQLKYWTKLSTQESVPKLSHPDQVQGRAQLSIENINNASDPGPFKELELHHDDTPAHSSHHQESFGKFHGKSLGRHQPKHSFDPFILISLSNTKNSSMNTHFSSVCNANTTALIWLNSPNFSSLG